MVGIDWVDLTPSSMIMVLLIILVFSCYMTMAGRRAYLGIKTVATKSYVT